MTRCARLQQKRYETDAKERLLAAVETAAGDIKVDDARRQAITKGAKEKDLVHSGLEDTMSVAYHLIREKSKKDVCAISPPPYSDVMIPHCSP